jgi:hypothetical protein
MAAKSRKIKQVSCRRRKWQPGRLGALIVVSLLGGTNVALTQTVMDELGGTRQRLAMTCTTMILTSSQGASPTVTRHLTEALNKNSQLRRSNEPNAQFLSRFLDFHAGMAGLVSGRQQPQEILDRIHRASFLLSSLASSGDTDALRRIAESCVLTFRASQ